jgi:heterodisulfide reductase subunit A-like polyferredoxin
MRSFHTIRLVIAFLLASLLVRAGVAATMPITMAVTQNQSAVHTMASMPSDCPGHALLDTEGQAENASTVSCTSCGECCVTAPTVAFDPTALLVDARHQALNVFLTLPPLSYLTPGIDRPPSF